MHTFVVYFCIYIMYLYPNHSNNSRLFYQLYCGLATRLLMLLLESHLDVAGPRPKFCGGPRINRKD